jgi:DNA-binding MarR family transcriptional regulator
MAARDTRKPGAKTGSVLEERRTSPGLLLALLGQEAMRVLRDAHAAVELSPRHFQLLGLLHDQGPMGQRDLGGLMGVEPSVLVTLLNPLEVSGFVSRRRDAADRRRHVVSLNAAGERRLVRAARAQREAEDELFSGLNDKQRRQLAVLLLAVSDGLAVQSECAST